MCPGMTGKGVTGVLGDRCGPWVGMLRALCAQTGGLQAAGVRIPGGQEDRGGSNGVLAGSKQHRNTFFRNHYTKQQELGGQAASTAPGLHPGTLSKQPRPPQAQEGRGHPWGPYDDGR